MSSPSASPDTRPDRTLYAINLCSSAIGYALTISAAIVNRRFLPWYGLIPLTMSVVVSIAALANRHKPNPQRPYADLAVAMSFAVILVPTYVHMHSNGQFPS